MDVKLKRSLFPGTKAEYLAWMETLPQTLAESLLNEDEVTIDEAFSISTTIIACLPALEGRRQEMVSHFLKELMMVIQRTLH
jgi:hypothetical protein